jgi:methylglyoxal synthase
MEKIKRIALVAHDNRKGDLREWIEYNYRTPGLPQAGFYGNDWPAGRREHQAQN